MKTKQPAIDKKIDSGDPAKTFRELVEAHEARALSSGSHAEACTRLSLKEDEILRKSGIGYVLPSKIEKYEVITW